MRYLDIAGVSKPLSTLAMGSTYIGSAIDERTSLALLDTFAEAGGTTIDTARMYGDGASERLIGRWLASTGCRKEITLVGKGLHNAPDGSSRFSLENLREDIERSREALGSESFDLWLFHRDNRSMPVKEIMDMVAPFVEKGIIKALGASNWEIDRLEAANRYARLRNLPPIRISEIQWSLARSTPASWEDPSLVCMDDASLAWYRANRMPLLAFSSQAKGYFSKVIAQGFDHLSPKTRARFHTPENALLVERVRDLANRMRIGVAAVVTGYVTSAMMPSIAIIGCSSVAQLRDTLGGADVKLNPSQIEYLERGCMYAT